MLARQAQQQRGLSMDAGKVFQMHGHYVHRELGVGRVVKSEEFVVTGGESVRMLYFLVDTVTVRFAEGRAVHFLCELPTVSVFEEMVRTVYQKPAVSLRGHWWQLKRRLADKLASGDWQQIAEVARDTASFDMSVMKAERLEVYRAASSRLVAALATLHGLTLDEAAQHLATVAPGQPTFLYGRQAFVAPKRGVR